MNNQFIILINERLDRLIEENREILATALSDLEITNLGQTLNLTGFPNSQNGFYSIRANFDKIDNLPEIKEEVLKIMEEVQNILNK